ncbi:MAG: hypothetical protein HN704_02635 [Bacteroidetes bacterium]|jgi:hypothetical protein|nr:hypothetical protein [Bacteroidota bacterium]MBT6686328.1 hypothetical protein [Bacteroidota bacterium]MBT7142161.1 hypothetical protein [Bacteroidota bacterium]MBT7490484.1 hypothetical protein [Bacteroidota bacterium]
MKKSLIIVLVVFAPFFLKGQKNGDIGLMAGTSYYLGDINPTYHFQSIHPAFGLMYRHSFDFRYSLRGSLVYGQLSGDDLLYNNNYQELRAASFSTPFLNFAFQLEFNFLPYITTSDKHRLAPYVTAGLNWFYTPDVKLQMGIPFGLGFKFYITEKLSMGCEWGLRKTFTDEIDGLGEYDGNPLIDDIFDNEKDEYRQLSIKNHNDWFSYAGIFITYKFFYKRIKCPAYGELDMYE